MEIDTVRYDAGTVAVRFVCTNICDSPVRIVEVRSQCGCTKPSFSAEAIEPGAKAHVDVEFDPSSLFADVSRHLTVVATNGDYYKFNTITVHGYVERDVTEEEVRYPHELTPGLRSEVSVLGMRLNRRGAVSEKEFRIYNATEFPMPLSWSSDSPLVRAEMPSELASGSSARVKVRLDTSGLPEGEYVEYLHILAGGAEATVVLKGAVE